jgi:peptidoglycan/xylan/chitin deacetylase (PgdA/CDA1 family)
MRAAGRAALAATAAGLVQLAPSVAVLGQWTAARRLGPVVWSGDPAPGTPVAVTFDDGPSPHATPAVLDRLDALGLRATFFPNGAAVDRHPDLAAELSARGHQVETHGYSHRHHLWASPAWVAADIDRATAAMARIEVRPRWLRPPYGQVSAGTVAAARGAGLRLALWSAWGREWATADAAAVARRVIDRLRPGAVVLLHDSDEFSPPGAAARALDALGRIADEMDRRQLPAATLNEVVGW